MERLVFGGLVVNFRDLVCTCLLTSVCAQPTPAAVCRLPLVAIRVGPPSGARQPLHNPWNPHCALGWGGGLQPAAEYLP